jgi:predicted RNA-binding Zn-ribbon protein involved in translation (DUF1610 family)
MAELLICERCETAFEREETEYDAVCPTCGKLPGRNSLFRQTQRGNQTHEDSQPTRQL